MKKLSLLLALLLVIACLSAAMAEPQTDYAFPNPIAIQNKTEVYGNWTFTGAGLLGIYMSQEDIGLTAEMKITETDMTLTFGEDYGASSWEILSDGTLQFTDPDGTTGIVLLNDDGTLSTDTTTNIDGTDYTLTLYFTRVPEA